MKRKILLSLMLCSTPTMTLSETSCFLFGKKDKDKIIIVDISNKEFNDIPYDNIPTGDLLYKEVRTQVAGWASPAVTVDKIKADTNIIIEIMNSDGLSVMADNDDTYVSPIPYDVKITILESDKYFKLQNETTYSLNIIDDSGIIDISAKEFNNADLSGYYAPIVYTELRTQVAGWANPAVTEDNIENDTNITILAYYNQSGNLLIDSPSFLYYTGLYDIKITVLANDLYFKAQDETNYSITIT